MSVIVKSMGKPKAPTIEYEQIINYTMIYDNGDECAEVHGGWSVSGYVNGSYTMKAGTKNSNNFTMTGVAGAMALLGIANPIDITDYTKAIVRGRSTRLASNIGGYLTVSATKDLNVEPFSSVHIPSTLSFATLDLSSVALENAYFSMYVAGIRTCVFYSAFLVKADDYATLASKAGITATSINDILTASSTLLANEDAVNFMVAQCTGDFMASAIANSTFLTALNNSPYKSIVQGNEHWAKFLAMVA